MNEMSTGEIKRNPFETLGLPVDADEQQVRMRYLELVKQYPPERDPDKFREIQAAFESARDPLAIAQSMLELPDSDDPPTWQAVIEAQSHRPPAMKVDFLLSLGNQANTQASNTQTSKQPNADAQQSGDAESADESKNQNASGEFNG